MSALIVAPQCKFKTDSRRHWPIHRGDERAGYVCLDCHLQMLSDMSNFAKGEPPRFCHECGRSFESLATAAPGDSVKMIGYQRKDGCAQIICLDCDAKIAPKMFQPHQVKQQQRGLLIAQSVDAREAIKQAGLGDKARVYDYWRERVGTMRRI